MKQRLWPNRFEFDRLLRQAIVSLSENAGEMAIGTSDGGYITNSGTVNILDHKEFWDIDVARTALNILDRTELLEEIFNRTPFGNDVKTIIGSEIGIENMENCAFVYTKYNTGNKSGFVCVFGPARLKYETVIPAVRYTKNLIEELGESW
jgi:heat-inducible transcriptional repressor